MRCNVYISALLLLVGITHFTVWRVDYKCDRPNSKNSSNSPEASTRCALMLTILECIRTESSDSCSTALEVPLIVF